MTKKPLILSFEAGPADIQTLAEIDALAFEAASKPRRWFSKQILGSPDDVVCYTGSLASTGKTVGYLLMHLSPFGDAMYEGIISRFAVIPQYQRQGVGSSIFRTVIAVDRPPNVIRFACMVPEIDLTSQLFLRSQGFKVPGVRGIVNDQYKFVLTIPQ